LYCIVIPSAFSLGCGREGGGRGTIVSRNSPILIERPAPNSKVQNLHNDIIPHHISPHDLDRELLPQSESKFVVQKKETYFAAPYCMYHGLLDEEGEFRTADAGLDRLGGEKGNVAWKHEVAVEVGNDVHY
jgi:hypothetical protein